MLKQIYLTLIQWLKQAWLLPKTIIQAAGQWKQQAQLKEREVERLDRIRNPSKYQGK